MSQSIDINYCGRVSRFVLRPVERESLHGFKRRVALDEQGNECSSALLTRDGRSILSAGSTAETYLDPNGDAVKRSELVAVDVDGKPLPTLTATLGRPQAIEGAIDLDEFLDHVVTRVYALEAETFEPLLDKALRGGAIYRVPFRPRASHTDTPAFLLANDHGVFLVQAEICNFDFVGLEQMVSDADALDESDAEFSEDDEFAFDLEWEADHAVA
jgi:hypothetical protein